MCRLSNFKESVKKINFLIIFLNACFNQEYFIHLIFFFFNNKYIYQNKKKMENAHDKVLTCFEATMYGELDCLKYAYENYCPMDGICECAVRHGQLDCLKYAHEITGCDLNTSSVCSAGIDAAKYGYLDCLKYLHEHCMKFNAYAINAGIYAAKNGHLDCLKYLHENGMELTKSMCWEAAHNNRQDCLKYYRENV